jgi:quercetin dioxygenase-like cupin family protein
MDKIERDRKHNEGFADSYVKAEKACWVEFGPGIQMRLLRATPETGHWSALFKCAKGSTFGRHEHLGAGEYYVISGTAVLRGGAERGGNTSRAGDYAYEPNGVIHDATEFPEESLVYFSNDGPLKFIDDDNNILFICDWRTVRDAARAGEAAEAGLHSKPTGADRSGKHKVTS